MNNNYLLDIEGRTEENAVSKILSDGFDYRVTRRDGVNYMITCDFDMARVNLEIDNHIVTTASLG